MDFRKTGTWVIAVLAVSAIAFLYRTYNPDENKYFPKCPFRELTGLQCPGCGSQRAMHYLLNFDMVNAAKENAILVFSIPYILAGLTFSLIRKPNEALLRWRKTFFGHKAIYVVLFIIAGFWIWRNIAD
jgi:hypothetical protein